MIKKEEYTVVIVDDHSLFASSLEKLINTFLDFKVLYHAKNGKVLQQMISGENGVPDIILLDDAFQHRRVKAGFYILLTAFDDLYSNDFVLPTGNLRESRNGAKRADLIVVTKCSKNISEEEMQRIKKELGSTKKVFFSTIAYDDLVYNDKSSLTVSDIKSSDKLLVAGIAKPDFFFDYLKLPNNNVLSFPDHHNFSDDDIEKIKNIAKNNLIITTEKDFVRLNGKLPNNQLYYLPIKSTFVIHASGFDSEINRFVQDF